MTRPCFKAGAMVASAALFTTTAFAQDDCGSAMPIGDGATAFDNSAAMDEGPAFGCGVGAAFDLWFAYTAVAAGTLDVDTCGSGFDTRIEIYDSCGGTALGCNDDSCGLQSALSVAATGGTTYFIRVAGWNAATGMGTLNVSGPAIPDTCATANPITPGVLESFDTSAATDSGVAWACTGNTGIKDVWYTFTATDTYVADVSTCDMATYDTRIEVFDGACGALTSLACNDDGAGCSGFSSFTTVSLVNGTQYWVRVGGFNSGSSGAGDLLVSGPPPAVPNDECLGAITLVNGVSEAFDNTLATNSGGAPAWTCGGTSSAALDLWYEFTPLADGSVTVDTEGSTGDTRLAVYEGGCGSLVLVDCDDDGGTGLLSSITFAGTGGTTYYARVAGFSGNVISSGMITAQYLDSLPNDDCAGALPVGLGMTAYSNAGATDSGVDMSCVFNGETSDIWFTFTAANSCPVTVDLSGSDYDTGMAIYTGDCMSLVEVDCDDDGGTGLDSLITFDATAGTTYILQIGGFNGASGLGVINITEDGGVGSTVCAGDPNSTGVGASLKIFGSDVVADNDITISITELPLNSMGYVVTSQETNTVVNPGGSSGTLCIASFTMGRYAGNVLNSGTEGSVSFSPDVTMIPTPTGSEPAMAGETRYFQHWYRDVDGGGAPTSNFSSAQGVTFN